MIRGAVDAVGGEAAEAQGEVETHWGGAVPRRLLGDTPKAHEDVAVGDEELVGSSAGEPTCVLRVRLRRTAAEALAAATLLRLLLLRPLQHDRQLGEWSKCSGVTASGGGAASPPEAAEEAGLEAVSEASAAEAQEECAAGA